MLRGDLSNQMAPRLLVTFDGVIATIGDQEKFDSLYDEEDYEGAMDQFIINNNVINRILYLTWKRDYNIDVITWLNPFMAEAMEDYLADRSIPVRGVDAWWPENLAHELSYRPDILCIYDADPGHVLLFGSKMILFTDANQIGA